MVNSANYQISRRKFVNFFIQRRKEDRATTIGITEIMRVQQKEIHFRGHRGDGSISSTDRHDPQHPRAQAVGRRGMFLVSLSIVSLAER